MSNEFDKINKQVSFMESHVGGNLNDTNTVFNNQKSIIQTDNNLYIDLLDDTNNLSRNRNTQDINKNTNEYIKEQKQSLFSKDTRINDYPTIVNDDINASNPIIYPKEYDPYFEYLSKKAIKSINTQVIQTKTIINIDSQNRQKESIMNVDSYIKLADNPIIFTNNSSIMKIILENANHFFTAGDNITLQGYTIYTITYNNVNFNFINGTNKVIIDLTPNYEIAIPYCNIQIIISGVSYNGLNYFKNISLNVINDVQTIDLYTTPSGETKFVFTIPMNFYTDNVNINTISSSCSISYLYIGNYPINYINCGLPISLFNQNSHLLVDSVNSKYLLVKLNNNISLINSNSIQLDGIWLNSSTFQTGGQHIQIGKILTMSQGYLSSSKYKILLDKQIDNVVCIKMKSSEIPNTTKLIYNTYESSNITIQNNILTWSNALDEQNNKYEIIIPSGNYTSYDLSILIETLIQKIPRKIINSNIIPFNYIKININQNNNITQLTSYNKYSLPNSIINLETNENYWILTINHPFHNQKIGNQIEITESINYKNIDSKYINKSHIITEILSNDSYKITLTNINPLDYYTDGNAGMAIIIITLNSFKLYFDDPNTIGTILGFKNCGKSGSITPYSNINNNYIIDNTQSYIYNYDNIQIVNNNKQNTQLFNNFNYDLGKYILLVCKNSLFNQCKNPNNIQYFYKFQLSSMTGSYIFNSFVDSPIYFNPPIKYIDNFEFEFLNENGNTFDFYGINNSMTFEITSITNYPENANLSTFIARI
jgi:hypothetical protein